MKHELSQDLIVKVLNYLALRPYGEVAQLISEVHAACAPAPEPEPKIKEAKR